MYRKPPGRFPCSHALITKNTINDFSFDLYFPKGVHYCTMAYTKAEIVVLPLMLLGITGICVIAYFTLRHVSTRYKRLIMLSIPITMLVLEIIKQINGLASGYTTWYLPFHFCSTFMIWFSLAEFSKNNSKIRRAGQSTGFVACVIFLALFYVNPISVIGNSSANPFASFGLFHTFFYHHLILLYLGLTIALKIYRPRLNDIPYVVILLSSYFAVGVTAAYLLNTNYCGFIENRVPFLEPIRLAVGNIIYLCLMYAAGIGGIILIMTTASAIVNPTLTKNQLSFFIPKNYRTEGD